MVFGKDALSVPYLGFCRVNSLLHSSSHGEPLCKIHASSMSKSCALSKPLYWANIAA
jgi:hypothetical protein